MKNAIRLGLFFIFVFHVIPALAQEPTGPRLQFINIHFQRPVVIPVTVIPQSPTVVDDPAETVSSCKVITHPHRGSHKISSVCDATEARKNVESLTFASN